MTNLFALDIKPFQSVPDLVREYALQQPDKTALIDGEKQLSYAALDRLMDRIAAALLRDGLKHGQAVASVAYPSVEQAAAFLGALRAGGVAAPLQISATAVQIAGMVENSGAETLFLDAAGAAALADEPISARVVALETWEAWLAPSDVAPVHVDIHPQDPFNIIYSSGTAGVPKGIVHDHQMRWFQLLRNAAMGYDHAVTLLATPLYSNTTLSSFLPTITWGGTVVLMRKFDARRYLELAQQFRATHTMLVPVQYQRIMALPDFDSFDLSSFTFKSCTSAPFKADLKADIVRRWPGALVEFYGMTEGGGAAALNAQEFPDKLHTVGRPLSGHDIRLIDDEGNEVGPGEVGEVVGHSHVMMTGYHGREQATRDATWISPDGRRFIRHGDVGRFDEDGFLILVDRKKDMIISGGFNIYPSDLEAVIAQHPAVAECAVIGVPSQAWGESPVGFYVPVESEQQNFTPDAILADINGKLGRTQRLAELHEVAELPRNAIGKIMKRELRERLLGTTEPH